MGEVVILRFPLRHFCVCCLKPLPRDLDQRLLLCEQCDFTADGLECEWLAQLIKGKVLR